MWLQKVPAHSGQWGSEESFSSDRQTSYSPAEGCAHKHPLLFLLGLPFPARYRTVTELLLPSSLELGKCLGAAQAVGVRRVYDKPIRKKLMVVQAQRSHAAARQARGDSRGEG